LKASPVKFTIKLKGALSFHFLQANSSSLLQVRQYAFLILLDFLFKLSYFAQFLNFYQLVFASVTLPLQTN